MKNMSRVSFTAIPFMMLLVDKPLIAATLPELVIVLPLVVVKLEMFGTDPPAELNNALSTAVSAAVDVPSPQVAPS